MGFDKQIDEVWARMRVLERRVAALEGSEAAAEEMPAPEPSRPERPPSASIDGYSWREWVPLLGRTLVVLGGAFLLRALTEAEILPQAGGIVLGLAYAVLWVGLSHRAATVERRPSAVSHAVTAGVIGYPLIWESTVQFHFLPPVASYVALLALTSLGLLVAARHRLRSLGWIFTLGAAVTALALSVGVRQLAFGGSLLLILGAGTLWLGYLRNWDSLARVTALLVDAVLAFLTVIVLRGEGERAAELLRPETQVMLLIALMVVYIGSSTVRSMVRMREVDPFEIGQAVMAVLVGLGGGIAVVFSAGLSSVGLGIASLMLAAACYAIASSIDRRLPGRRSFLLFASLALLFTLAGFPLIFAADALVIAYAVAGLIIGWLGTWRGRATLNLHGAGYVLACAVTSGLLAMGFHAFVGALGTTRLGFGMWAALACAVASCGFRVETQGRTWGRFSTMPKVIVLLVSVVGLGGVLLVLLAPVVLSLEESHDAAALAVLRTAVLALSAVALAAASRWWRLQEAAWLVYPVLVVGGFKLLAEDIPAGRPATMVASLALFGGALILAPRFTRRSLQAVESATEEG